MAVACGLLVANLYYAQAAIEPISQGIGLSPSAAGLVVTLTQLGYAAGLLLIVCLADLVENRRLILTTMVGAIVGLVGVAIAPDAAVFLIASFVVGVCSVSAQVLVPLATHLAPEQSRGRVIGNVMGGLLTGIMLARPFSNFVTAWLGWRAVFVIAAAMCAALFVVLAMRLPSRRPETGMRYTEVLGSTFKILATERPLQRRALYQALMFGLFNMFWTAAPLMLHHTFGFGQVAIALFALAGAGGALSAPLAGRLADRGHAGAATGLAQAVMAAAFLASAWAVGATALLPLIVFVVLLDGSTQINQVVGQRIIYGIAPEARGRINSIYMFTAFLGGAAGSLISPALYNAGGWTLVALVGGITAAVTLGLFLTERFEPRAIAQS